MTTSGSGPGKPGPDPAQAGGREEAGASGRPGQAGGEAREEFRHGAEQARHKADSLKEEAKERAGRVFEDAKERASSAIEERKHGLAQDVDDMAHALRASARDLEQRNKPFAARYVEQAAASVEQIADTLHRQNLRDLTRNAEDFARRQPGLFVGGSVAAGFALARFLKSSAERRATTERESEEGYRAAAGATSPEPTPSASTAAYAATPSQVSSLGEGPGHGHGDR